MELQTTIAAATGAVLLLFLLALVVGVCLLLKALKLGIAPWLALFSVGALCVYVVLGYSGRRATDRSAMLDEIHELDMDQLDQQNKHHVPLLERYTGGDFGISQRERPLFVEKVDAVSDIAELPETLDRPAPAWVEDEPISLGGGTSMVIRSGPHARILDCEQSLNKELQKAVTAYVSQNIAHGKGHDVSVPPELMRDVVVVDEHVETRRHTFGDMHQIYQRLRFGREAHDQLWAWARESVVQQRLRNAGLGLGAVLLSLLTVFGYLRIDNVTEGRYRRRLGWSAAALCGLLVTGMAMLS